MAIKFSCQISSPHCRLKVIDTFHEINFFISTITTVQVYFFILPVQTHLQPSLNQHNSTFFTLQFMINVLLCRANSTRSLTARIWQLKATVSFLENMEPALEITYPEQNNNPLEIQASHSMLAREALTIPYSCLPRRP